MKRGGTLIERLERRHVLTDDGCWRWIGGTNGVGYGLITLTDAMGRRTTGVHRVAYELFHGPIPVGMTVDHICWNPPCFNPEHLQLLTPSENAARQRKASKTHCVNGHPYDDVNTYWRVGRGGRGCRACGAASKQAERDRRKWTS
jgi:hypothetical protein